MRRLVILFLFIMVLDLKAQQDPAMSQYMFNQLVINPACAGNIAERIATSFLYRRQWVALTNAPETGTFSIHTPFNQKRNGIGFQATYVNTDLTNDISVSGAYSFKIIFPRSYFAMGISGGFRQTSLNLQSKKIKDEDDIVLSKQNQISPDLNVGLYFQHKNYYLGLSCRNLFQSRFHIQNFKYPAQSFNFYATGGYKFTLSATVKIISSFLLKYVPQFTPQADISNHLIFNEMFWGGFSYRTNTIIAFQTGVKLDQVFKKLGQETRLGYAFDVFGRFPGVAHELMLLIDFELHKSPSTILKQKKQLSPFFL